MARKRTIRRRGITSGRRNVRRLSAEEKQDRPVTLDEVLVAFQKTLARASTNARELSRTDPDFVTGQKPLYIINGMNLSLNAILKPAVGMTDEGPDHIEVDFEGDPSEFSTIDFTINEVPLEAASSTALTLSHLDSLREDPTRIRIRLLLMGPKEKDPKIVQLPKCDFNWHIVLGDNASGPVPGRTGSGKNAGLAYLTFDLDEQTFALGDDPPKPIRGTVSGNNLADALPEYLEVYATCNKPAAASNVLRIYLPEQIQEG